jgi:hypothetical protein
MILSHLLVKSETQAMNTITQVFNKNGSHFSAARGGGEMEMFFLNNRYFK